MGTNEAISDIKKLIQDLGLKFNTVSSKIDTLDDKFSTLLANVKSEVEMVKSDLNSTKVIIHESKDEIKKLRDDHYDLERGVQEMDTQLNILETQKMDSLRQDLDASIRELKVKHVLLEKHERKYNIMIYGLPEAAGENMDLFLPNFFKEHLGIIQDKAVEMPIANAHRVPTRTRPGQPKGPNPVIVRFIHYADKQFVISRGKRLMGTKIRMLDDLPIIMKEARHELANVAYTIRHDEKLQTKIRVNGVKLVLETRLNSRDVWQVRKTICAV